MSRLRQWIESKLAPENAVQLHFDAPPQDNREASRLEEQQVAAQLVARMVVQGTTEIVFLMPSQSDDLSVGE